MVRVYGIDSLGALLDYTVRQSGVFVMVGAFGAGLIWNGLRIFRDNFPRERAGFPGVFSPSAVGNTPRQRKSASRDQSVSAGSL